MTDDDNRDDNRDKDPHRDLDNDAAEGALTRADLGTLTRCSQLATLLRWSNFARPSDLRGGSMGFEICEPEPVSRPGSTDWRLSRVFLCTMDQGEARSGFFVRSELRHPWALPIA